jgi:drug/metabolite transporter (DMT)-like permease
MPTVFYTALALGAFAANSVLCRIALSHGAIDAATFTSVRLVAGALTLLAVSAFGRRKSDHAGSWLSAGLVALYAVPFAFGYTNLTIGTGALILFFSVQATMMGSALWTGERPRPMQWAGLVLAFAGIVYLVLPGLAAPPLTAASLMVLAGCSWGVYSLRGRGSSDPLAQTTTNFVRAVPFALAANLATVGHLHAETKGVVLALLSGSLASGLGYVVWYQALRGLSAMRAAVVQLSVPVLAAAAGVIFLGEIISARLVVSAAAVIGGLALALIGREGLARRP